MHTAPALPLFDETDDEEEPDITSNDSTTELSHHCFAACIPATSTGQIYTDLTSKFQSAASSGATKLFVLYDYDSNAPMSTRTGPDIIKAFKAIHNTLVKAGLRPQRQRMDNEVS
jgi:hypothetical protein